MTEYIEIGNLTAGLVAGLLIAFLMLRTDVRQFFEETKGGKLSGTRADAHALTIALVYLIMADKKLPDINGWWFAFFMGIFFLQKVTVTQLTNLVDKLKGGN